jgi:hypothetical protein
VKTEAILLSIEILALALFLGLPFLAKIINDTTEKISFVLFLILFWLISGFTSIVAVYRWSIMING